MSRAPARPDPDGPHRPARPVVGPQRRLTVVGQGVRDAGGEGISHRVFGGRRGSARGAGAQGEGGSERRDRGYGSGAYGGETRHVDLCSARTAQFPVAAWGRDCTAGKITGVGLVLYDTRTRRVRPFEPLMPGRSACTCAGRPCSPRRTSATCAARSRRHAAPLADRHRLRGHARPQRHRHRRQDHRQRGRGRRAVVAIVDRASPASSTARTARSAACRRRRAARDRPHPRDRSS